MLDWQLCQICYPLEIKLLLLLLLCLVEMLLVFPHHYIMCTRHYDWNRCRHVECICVLPCPFIVTLHENAILICFLTIISFAYSFMISKHVNSICILRMPL